jgi:hypothetical protein
MAALRCITLVLVMVTLHASAQVTWRRSYGAFEEDLCYAARAVSPDRIIAVGSTGSFGNGNSDIYLMATDGNGIRIWSRTIGGPGVERPTSMRVCDNGDLIIAGITTGEGGYDGLLVRTDAEGELLWSRVYGGSDWDFLHDVKELPDGGLLLAGETFSFGEPGGNAWILRTDAAGDTLWTRTFGGSGGHQAHSAIATLDGGYILAGSLITPDRDRDVLVVKMDASGGTEWTRTYGGDSLDVANDIIIAPNGGYSVVGGTSSFSVWSEGYHLRVLEDGTLDWQFHWGLIADRQFKEHLVLPDGEYMIVGYTEGYGGGKKDMILQKATINGGYIYGYTFGGTEDDEGYSVDVIGNGFLVGGSTRSYGAGAWDMFLVRTDMEGLTASQSVQTSFDPLSIEETLDTSVRLSVFPNPSDGEVGYVVDGTPLSVSVLDAMGRVVEVHHDMGGRSSIRSSLPSGHYILEVLLKEGMVRRGRVQLIRP